MVDRLRVTELDFDTIKNNLKSFLKQQSTFTDYDFDGSGLSVLIDLLAYNTHYNAYYLNMVANESFLDTALLRDSAVSHAKTLGYTPHSRKASVVKAVFLVSYNIVESTKTNVKSGSTNSASNPKRAFGLIILSLILSFSASDTKKLSLAFKDKNTLP